jgi:hypothetical protein
MPNEPLLTEPMPPDPDAAGLIPIPLFPVDQTPVPLGDLELADLPYIEDDDDAAE